MAFNLKQTIILLLPITVIVACNNNHANSVRLPPKECIKLNNAGVDYLMNHDMSGKKGLDTAIGLFKQAIACDTAYYIPYMGLTNAYDRKGEYLEEMASYNRLLPLVNNQPAFLMEKGMLFERMNKTDSAKKLYDLTETGYKKVLTKYPEDVEAIKGLILLKAVTDGKDTALTEIAKQIKNHPTLSSGLSAEYWFYKDFDRDAFVYRRAVEVTVGK